MPFTGDGSLAMVEPFEQQRREAHDPAMDRGMVDVNTALGHHLFQVPKAEIVRQIPAHTQQDHRTIVMAV